MKKNKEDAETTKNRLLEAAFEVFFDVGFEKASLEKISKTAGVTRGAAYWHFNNKQDLYEHTIRNVLNEMAVQKKKIISDVDMDWKMIVVNLIFLPHQMKKEFQFIEKSILFLSHSEDFIEIKQDIEEAKKQLYTYFLDKVQEQSKVDSKFSRYKLEEVATMLYIMFEGMYSYSIPENIDKSITRETIENCVHMIFN